MRWAVASKARQTATAVELRCRGTLTCRNVTLMNQSSDAATPARNERRRFLIRFDRWYAVLSGALAIFPSSSRVEIDGDEVRVRMGWAFRARFPRSSVVATVEMNERPLSRGVHGFAGRWLVNGSGRGIVTIDLSPDQRGYVMGFPVRLRQLMVSVDEPGALMLALRTGSR